MVIDLRFSLLQNEYLTQLIIETIVGFVWQRSVMGLTVELDRWLVLALGIEECRINDEDAWGWSGCNFRASLHTQPSRRVFSCSGDWGKRVMFFDTWSRQKHFNRILVETNLEKTSFTTLQCSFLGRLTLVLVYIFSVYKCLYYYFYKW